VMSVESRDERKIFVNGGPSVHPRNSNILPPVPASNLGVPDQNFKYDYYSFSLVSSTA
jgi:hypothetical protein